MISSESIPLSVSVSVPLSILLGTSGGCGLADLLRFSTSAAKSVLFGERRPFFSSVIRCNRNAAEDLPSYGELGSPFARVDEFGGIPDAGTCALVVPWGKLSDLCGKYDCMIFDGGLSAGSTGALRGVGKASVRG